MAKRTESHGDIDWSAADVKDAALTVPLSGEPSKAWADRVAEVLDRLGTTGKGWGAIKVTKEQLTVEAVEAGSEGDLRHLLEGAVMQANADFAPEEQPAAEGDEGASAEDDELAGTFRDFAPGDDAPDE